MPKLPVFLLVAFSVLNQAALAQEFRPGEHEKDYGNEIDRWGEIDAFEYNYILPVR